MQSQRRRVRSTRADPQWTRRGPLHGTSSRDPSSALVRVRPRERTPVQRRALNSCAISSSNSGRTRRPCSNHGPRAISLRTLCCVSTITWLRLVSFFRDRGNGSRAGGRPSSPSATSCRLSIKSGRGRRLASFASVGSEDFPTSTNSSCITRTCARNGREPRMSGPDLDAALWRNVARAPWFLARHLHGGGTRTRVGGDKRASASPARRADGSDRRAAGRTPAVSLWTIGRCRRRGHRSACGHCRRSQYNVRHVSV